MVDRGRGSRDRIVGSSAYYTVASVVNPRSERQRRKRVRRRARIFVIGYTVLLIAGITAFFYFHPT